MKSTIRGQGLKATAATAATAALALVLLSAVAFAMWSATTTSASRSDPAVHVASAGGSSIAHDPYIDRHAEVVTRYYEGGLR